MELSRLKNRTILLSALDWGFGHTTRCVPMIQTLIMANNTVVFAGNTEQILFIKKEFPTIQVEFLEGYNIVLSSKINTYLQLIRQGVKIRNAIKAERIFVKNILRKYSIDLVLSDNRYGFRDSNIESIFIGHQFNLQLPKFEKTVNRFLANLVNQFNRVWIVDDVSINLAGLLSNPIHLKVPYTYLGLLSRFNKKEVSIKYDYLIIVSGPKPENSIFLAELELLIKNSRLNFAIVSTVKSIHNFKHIHYFLNPSTRELNNLLNESEVVLSKSGYTTLMELSVLNKKAILIPTKGQFEQEYLANYVKNDLFRFIKSSDVKGLFV